MNYIGLYSFETDFEIQILTLFKLSVDTKNACTYIRLSIFTRLERVILKLFVSYYDNKSLCSTGMNIDKLRCF